MNPIENAARSLARAGRWTDALSLLDAFPTERSLDVVRAEVAVDHDFWTGADTAGPRLAVLADDGWDATILRVRVAYTEQVRRLLAGGAPQPEVLATYLERLIAAAPDVRAKAEGNLYLGLVLDVLGNDGERAEPHYRAATNTPDDYVAGYALRHLGALADDAGDRAAAVALWQESLAKRQACGHLTGSLAQLLLLRDEMSLAETVGEWAERLDLKILAAQAKAS